MISAPRQWMLDRHGGADGRRCRKPRGLRIDSQCNAHSGGGAVRASARDAGRAGAQRALIHEHAGVQAVNDAIVRLALDPSLRLDMRAGTNALRRLRPLPQVQRSVRRLAAALSGGLASNQMGQR
jgi:hypothetical protein